MHRLIIKKTILKIKKWLNCSFFVSFLIFWNLSVLPLYVGYSDSPGNLVKDIMLLRNPSFFCAIDHWTTLKLCPCVGIVFHVMTGKAALAYDLRLQALRHLYAVRRFGEYFQILPNLTVTSVGFCLETGSTKLNNLPEHIPARPRGPTLRLRWAAAWDLYETKPCFNQIHTQTDMPRDSGKVLQHFGHLLQQPCDYNEVIEIAYMRNALVVYCSFRPVR